MSHGAARVGPRMTPLAVTATTAKKSMPRGTLSLAASAKFWGSNRILPK